MEISINESTGIRNGTITIDGRKRNYTAFCGNTGESPSWEVSVLITNSFGNIVDAFTRTVYFTRHPYASDAITAAISEWKADQKEAA